MLWPRPFRGRATFRVLCRLLFSTLQVTSLRTAFTLNASLKRLFMSATSLTSDGAIALAEFLPESQSLYHLDLTSNPMLDLAGIVALNAGLKKNTVMRCLDLDIPPGNEELSRYDGGSQPWAIEGS